MIKALIKAYNTVQNKSKLKLIERMMGNENYFRDEIIFYDEGRVISGIIHIKNDLKKIDTEIEFVKKSYDENDEKKDKLNFLYNKQHEYIKLISFHGSQNIKNIDESIAIWGDIKDNFIICLYGIKEYINNNKDEAYRLLNIYLDKGYSFENHYLLNKIYGEIMFEKKSYAEAYKFFIKAIQYCPEDIDIHLKLKEIYQYIGNENKLKVTNDIINILGDD